MPSIRGMEKPHTSASTAATLYPAWASAIDRLVVTDDFPTPPLPDATASTRVRAVVNGFSRCPLAPSGWSWLTSAFCSASVITARSMATVSAPGTAARAACTRSRSSPRGGYSFVGSATVTRMKWSLADHRLHHLEVDDGAVELRVLHRLEGLHDGRLCGHAFLLPGEFTLRNQ